MADITQILLNAGSMQANLRDPAMDALNKAKQSNLPMFLDALISELANEQRQIEVRMQAGLLLKNTFESKDEQTKNHLAQQWRGVAPDVKNKIKLKTMATLHSPSKDARRVCAIILATLAGIELQQGQWIDVIQELVNNVTKPRSEGGVEASLSAIGFLCETSTSEALKTQSDGILTAVIRGMRPDVKNTEIRLAGTKALLACLEFVEKNFSNDRERDFIMKTICETTLAPEVEIRVAAFQCLVKVAQTYYHTIKPYVEQAIFQITAKAIKQDEEEVALQAIEFWSTVAEIEADIIEQMKEGDDEQELVLHELCLKYLQPLVGLLAEALLQQEEDQDDDEWNKSNAAGTCLSLLAKVAGDKIVGVVMPFISQNIGNANWKYREAATLAFSAILDGPTSKQDMAQLVTKALPALLNHVKDQHALVRDTAVFTLGRIALFHPDSLLDNEQQLEQVLAAMVFASKDVPKVAAKACWAIHNVAEAVEKKHDEEKPTGPLSRYFRGLVEALVAASDRKEVSESNLRINIYEALGALISSAARDVYPLLDSIAQLIITRLRNTLQSTQPSEEIILIQGLLCGTLQSLIQKLGNDIKKYSDEIMKVFLGVFNYRASSVHEEALMAVGALAAALGQEFDRYMVPFAPILGNALKNKAEEQVCSSAVNVVGDLCRALGPLMNKYSDDIVTILLQNLQDPAISKYIKPAILATFGDIAMAIGGNFEKYLRYVGLVLKQASEAQVDTSNDEMVEYVNVLRENIFEAYTGILQGLKKEKPQAFHPYVEQLFNFLKVISNDKTVDSVVFKSAVSVIGDLANVYGARTKPFMSQDFVTGLIRDALSSEDPETKESGIWASKEIQKILAA